MEIEMVKEGWESIPDCITIGTVTYQVGCENVAAISLEQIITGYNVDRNAIYDYFWVVVDDDEVRLAECRRGKEEHLHYKKSWRERSTVDLPDWAAAVSSRALAER